MLELEVGMRTKDVVAYAGTAIHNEIYPCLCLCLPVSACLPPCLPACIYPRVNASRRLREAEAVFYCWNVWRRPPLLLAAEELGIDFAVDASTKTKVGRVCEQLNIETGWESASAAAPAGEKTRLFAPFHTKNDHFTRTGSG
jgi:hypothetical protein